MKIDLHVHSKYSMRPSQWVLKKINCPESFTEPLQVYQIAKERGMSHVTITDHNSIAGALEIAHLPDTFVSEEVTTYFPDTHCKIHVLALNITEAHHQEIQKIRNTIFDLAAYLQQQNVFHIVAHPLYSINDQLTPDHFEQLLLLFQNFELNGARNQRENQCLQQIAQGLTPQTMDRLAEKHRFAPLHPNAWQKQLWGGSDDHSSLNIARTYTSIDAFDTPAQLFGPLAQGTPEVISQSATPLTMAHNLYGIAYQFYRSKFNLGRFADKDRLMGFLDHNLRETSSSGPGPLARIYLLWRHRKEKKQTSPMSDSLLSLLRHETLRLILEDPDFISRDDERGAFVEREQRWFDFVNKATDRVMLHFGNHLLDHLSGANVFNIFHTIGSAGGLYAMLAPYFVAYAQFAKDRTLGESVRQRFGLPSANSESGGDQALFPQVAHFTDTFYEVNGVALTLQQHVKYAQKNQKAFTIITCHDHCNNQPGVENFEPIGAYELPEYPELKIFYPPFLKMLNYCYVNGFNHLHTATPGPIGLAALAIARILKLPISGTYHTAIPQYARILTGDEAIEDLAWKYMIWYYNQLDVIYVPSQSTFDELVQKGINARKIRIYPRGIDVDQFRPSKGNGIYKERFGVTNGIKLLYVGRVSREKNLHLLADAFRQLVQKQPGAHLVVVGDGPYLQGMRAAMADLPCCFTGYQSGETLAELYASADLFVFPSTTDTFGNVVLEAQASGLPVIVTDQGGPCENIMPDHTGLIVKADDTQSLLAAMEDLVSSPSRLRAMGLAARHYAEQRSFETAFLDTWRMYQEDLRVLKAG